MNTHRRTLHPAWCRKELGHALLHDPARTGTDPRDIHRGVLEVEAESVAHLIGAAHGMDTSSYTLP